jgi:transcriptional repressor NrdR
MSSAYTCPQCGEPTSVSDTRAWEKGIRRRRRCLRCQYRFTTYEYEAKPNDRLIARKLEALAKYIQERVG